jgi:dephospho-CoA kinase
MKTKIIGLTGGIGSGKSTIARYFLDLGVPVYIADEEAKKILFQPQAVKEVAEAFGPGILNNGVPDKAKIAALVFKDPAKLQILNNIIHPKVAQHFKDWVKSNNTKPFVIKETAILFESGSYKDCDAVIMVTAPTETRIERVMQRDNISREQVLERIANQWDDQKKAELSNYIIDNYNLDIAKEEVVKIFKFLNIIEI